MQRPLVALFRAIPKSFSEAIVRPHIAAAATAASAARASIDGADVASNEIDVPKAIEQHQKYMDTVKMYVDYSQCLEADEAHPDSPFIEDTVVFVRGTAVITSLGHVTRRGETAAMRKELETNPYLKGIKIKTLEDEEARLEGGDVMFTGRHLFVGLSKRTNQAGAQALQKCVGPSVPMHTVDLSDMPSLHLKSIVTQLKQGLLVFAKTDEGMDIMGQMVDRVGRHAYKAIAVPDPDCANVLNIQGAEWRGAILNGQCQESVSLIRGAFDVSEQKRLIELDISEIVKADAALTCCSLILQPSGGITTNV